MTRPQQINEQYLIFIDQHLKALADGSVEKMYELEDFAELLCIHPTHLSNVIKQETGISACGIYQLKIIEVAHQLLNESGRPIKDIAYTLDFEPTQFTKWFKKFHGITPKEYRAGKPYQLSY